MKGRHAHWLAILMFALTFLMHLFVFAWMLGAAIILIVIPRLPEPLRRCAYLGSMALSLLPLPFIHRMTFNLWELDQLKSIFGSDQINVFGDGSYAVFVIINLIFVSLLLTNRDQLLPVMKSPLAWLYLMNAVFIFTVPHALTWPAGNGEASNGLPPLSMLSFLTERFACLQGMLLVALMAKMTWEKWQKVAITAALCLHFIMAYQTAEKMRWAEHKLDEMITQLPQGA